MNIAAVTMVYHGYPMLKRWYEHYGRLVGFDNLYVVSHGADPEHRAMTPRANFIGIPRTGLERFDMTRHAALNNLGRFLDSYHDVVLRTDVDEFVFFDPDIHDSLKDCLNSVECDAWFTVGFNVYERADDPPLSPEAPISAQRSHCVFSSSYSKAVAARNGISLGHHGARDSERKDASRMGLPRGFYLAHVRFAEQASIHGSGAYDGAVIFNRTESRTLANLEKALALPETDGDRELADCYESLVGRFGPHRKGRPKLMVAPRRMATHSFRLPQRFVGAF